MASPIRLDMATVSLPEEAKTIPSLAFLAAQYILRNSSECISHYKSQGLQHHEVKVRNTTSFDIERVQTALRGLDLPEDVFIFTTGSDAKEEKLVCQESPVELVLLCSEATRATIEHKIIQLVQSKLIHFDEIIEWKDPENLSMCQYITESGARSIPSRYMHTYTLFGSVEQGLENIRVLADQMKAMPRRHRKQFKDSYVNESMKRLKEVCDNHHNTDVNLVNGTISYTAAGKKATKYSLLRSIQYNIDFQILDEVRKPDRSVDWCIDLLANMPRSVPEIIEYIFERALCPQWERPDVEKLKAAYNLGLFYFHIAQSLKAAKKGEPITLLQIPDVEELRAAYTDTLRILEK